MSQAPPMQVPERLPLLVMTSNRNYKVDKDARLVNCYLEFDETGELWIYKRPGLLDYQEVLPDSPGLGLYYWQGSVYSVFGDRLFRNGFQVASGLNMSGGMYKFDSNLGATPQLILGNGYETYSYTENGGLIGPLHVTSTGFPVLTTKGFAYLNGYEYVMTREAYIHNSELNSIDQPTDWNPINFIRAQIEPDFGIFLAKQLVYVVALKQWTTEFFFNAENAAGSPLGSVQGMKANYGCANPNSVVSIDDVLFWMSTNRSASKQIICMDKGAVRVISTPAIDRLLEGAENSQNAVVYAWHLKTSGHSFYIITLKDINLTLAYDIVMDKWFQWTDADGNYFPIVDSTYDMAGTHILQHESDGNLYRINPNYYTDVGRAITVDIITPNFDAGTRRRKTLGYMWAIADQQDNSSLGVRFSEDDYISWSSWRFMDLSQGNPYLKDCGTFKKRAYHLQHNKPTPFRIQAIEIQYDLGTM